MPAARPEERRLDLGFKDLFVGLGVHGRLGLRFKLNEFVVY